MITAATNHASCISFHPCEEKGEKKKKKRKTKYTSIYKLKSPSETLKYILILFIVKIIIAYINLIKLIAVA